EQAVEREQRCEQCPDPEDCRTDPGKQLHVRPDAERRQHDHREEEEERHEGAAAAPKGKANGLRGDGGDPPDHAARPRSSVAAAATGSGRWVAATTIPPEER